MPKLKSPPKTRGFRLRDLYKLQYRFYAIIVILILPVILYSGDVGVKDNIAVDAGYKVAETNFVASRIVRDRAKNPYIQQNVEAEKIMATSNLEQTIKIKPKIFSNSISVVDGEIKAFVEINNKPMVDSSLEFLGSSLYSQYIKGSNNNNNKRESLSSIFPAPERGIKYSQLIFAKYKVQTPIQWADFNDLYQKKGDSFDFNNLLDQDPKNAPIQKKLQDGIVHLGYTVQPGEIGNSYIVGHSSNFSEVKSDYNTIFKPLESVTKAGDDFVIFDREGRELKFCVFDALKIEDKDIEIAYKEFPGERIVTLQTSILGWRDGEYKATHRWITRAKLCTPTKN